MKRILHLGLLLCALIGLTGQATARVNALDCTAALIQLSSVSASCGDDMGQALPANAPCKKVGMQCLDAVGCPAMTLARPGVSIEAPATVEQVKSAAALAEALHGRSVAPEPEPPTLLI